MTPKQQQTRRLQLHKMPIKKLEKLYADTTGHLVFEVQNMNAGLYDQGQQVMIDVIVHAEANP